MSAEQLFTITNTLAVLGWLMLAVLPGRRWVTDVVTGTALPAGPAGWLVYMAVRQRPSRAASV